MLNEPVVNLLEDTRQTILKDNGKYVWNKHDIITGLLQPIVRRLQLTSATIKNASADYYLGRKDIIEIKGSYDYNDSEELAIGLFLISRDDKLNVRLNIRGLQMSFSKIQALGFLGNPLKVPLPADWPAKPNGNIFFDSNTQDFIFQQDNDATGIALPVLPGVILQQAGFGFIYNEADKSSLLEISALTTLNDNEFDCVFSIPLTENENWGFSLAANDEHLQPLDQTLSLLTSLTGVSDLHNQIPDILKEPFKTIALNALDFTTGAAATFRCRLSIIDELNIFPGLSLFGGTIKWAMERYGSKYSFDMELSGTLQAGQTIIDVRGNLSTNPTKSWHFSMKTGFTLNSMKDILSLMPGVTEESLGLTSHWMEINEILISRFDFSFVPAEKRIEQIDIEFSADAWIKPIEGIKFGQPEIVFIVTNTEQGYELGGLVSAELMVGETSFFGEAEKDASGWSFNATTGVIAPVPVKQFLDDLRVIIGTEIDISVLPDLKVADTNLRFHLSKNEFTFTSDITYQTKLPFLNQQGLAATFCVRIHTIQQEGKTVSDWNLLAKVNVGENIFAVLFDKEPEGKRSFMCGWKASVKDAATGLQDIFAMLGIQADVSALPAILNPQFSEIAFSYTEADHTFALSAHTTNGSDYFFVARKNAEAQWRYVLGLDYDAKSAAATEDIGELVNAANTVGLTQLHLLYAGTDLDNFKLPHVPDIAGKGTRQLDSGKLLNVKKGIFIAAEANNISVPQIGKLRADLKQFYVSVEKHEQVVVLVKGNMDFMADGQLVNIALQAGYASGTKDLTFQGKVTAKTGVAPLLNAIIGDQLQLPEGVSWPDISEAQLDFSTVDGTVAFKMATIPGRNDLTVAGLFSIGADQINLQLSKTQADIEIKGGHLQLEVLNPVFPGGVGGLLTLHLENAGNRFIFNPSGFEIVTPVINYQECVETKQAGSKTEPVSVTRSLCAKLTPGVFSFKKDNKQWAISAEATLVFQDLPDPVRRIFMEEKDKHWVSKPLKLTAGLKNGALFFAATGNLLELEIPDLMAEIGAKGLPAFGKSAIRVLGAGFHVGKDIALDLEFGYALPMRLNEVLGLEHVKLIKTLASPPNEQFTRFNFSIGSSGISGKLLDSPFYLLNGITEDGDKVHIDLDLVLNEKDLGRISFIKPVISLDAEKGTFKFKGGYDIDPLRPVAIPLTLLRRLFEAVKLNQVAQKLPKSIPVKTMKLDDTLHWLLDMLNRCGITLPQGLSDMLLSVQKIESSLPARFRSYLSLSVPQSLEASIDVTADGGVGFSLTTTGDPLQFLVPGPLAFIGLRLTHISLGTAMGGSLLKFECSAELDTFDYAELLLSATVYQSELIAQKLPPRDELQHTFAAKELLILVVYETGIPVPVPLFYQNLLFKFKGIEGLDIHTSISFPQPKVNVMKVLKIASDLKKLFSEGKDLEVTYPLSIQKDGDEPGLNLVFDAGPFYMRLPKYIAKGDDDNGRLFGWTTNYRLLDLMNLAGVLLNGINHLIKEKTPAYLVQALPLALRYNDTKIMPLDNLEASVAWLMATPKEVIKLHNDHQLPSAALEELVPLLNLLTFQPGAAPDIKAVTAPENAVLFFMQGALKVGSIANAKLSAALCWLPDGLASSMLIHVAAPDDVLLLHLDGKQAITQSNFQVAGNASLKLLGLNIFQGNFIAAKGRLFLEAGAFNIQGSPIGFYGKIDGIFDNNLVNLYGEAYFKFLFIETSAKIYLDLNNETDSSFRAESTTVVNQIFSGSLQFKSLLAQNSSFDAFVDLNLKVLNVFGIVYQQKTHIDPNNIQFQGKVNFLFFNQSFLSADLKYENGTFSVDAEFVLLNILRVKGGISLKDQYFYLKGELSFDLAGITTQGFIEVLSDATNKRFNIEINKLFGPENSLKFSLVNSGNVVEFKSDNERPISVLNGALLITGFDNEQTGPKFDMGFDSAGMQYLKTDAKISAFGLAKAEAKMQYANATKAFSARLKAKIDTNVVQADTELDMLYSTNLLLTGGFHLGIDLGAALNDVLSYYFSFPRPGLHFMVQFDLTDFEFSIECTPSPQSPDLREIEKAITETNKRIAEINALSKTSLDGLNELFKESDQTVNEIDAMLRQELTQGQREMLTKWKNKLPKNKTDIQPFINGHAEYNEKLPEARYRMNVAKDYVDEFDTNWDSMLTWFNSLDRKSAGLGIDWWGDKRSQMMEDKDSTAIFMGAVLQEVKSSEIDDIHENYYGKNCYRMPGSRTDCDHWLEIKKLELNNRKAGGYEWRKNDFYTAKSVVDDYLFQIGKYVNLYNNCAIPIMKADLLQSHIDIKLVNTYKKSSELAKHELPLTTSALDAGNANDAGMRVVFRAKASADIPGLGRVSLGEIRISWAGVSDLGNDSTLWQHLQRALNAYMSQQLVRIINEQFNSIWSIVACLERMITGGNALPNDNGVELTDMVAGFAQISTDTSKNMKNTIDNPPSLSIT